MLTVTISTPFNVAYKPKSIFPIHRTEDLRKKRQTGTPEKLDIRVCNFQYFFFVHVVLQ